MTGLYPCASVDSLRSSTPLRTPTPMFGFTSGQTFVLIDVTTGAASLVEAGDVSWWGAGVTTSAPVID